MTKYVFCTEYISLSNQNVLTSNCVDVARVKHLHVAGGSLACNKRKMHLWYKCQQTRGQEYCCMQMMCFYTYCMQHTNIENLPITETYMSSKAPNITCVILYIAFTKRCYWLHLFKHLALCAAVTLSIHFSGRVRQNYFNSLQFQTFIDTRTKAFHV